MKRRVYVNEERTIFVEIWAEETEYAGPDARIVTRGEEIVSVAQREAPDHTWGPPTRVILEDS